MWVCGESAVGPITFSDVDRTDLDAGILCIRLSDIADGLDIASQAFKGLRWLEQHATWPL